MPAIEASSYNAILEEIKTNLARRGASTSYTSVVRSAKIVTADTNYVLTSQNQIKYSTKPVATPQQGSKIMQQFLNAVGQVRDDIKYNHTCSACLGVCTTSCSGSCSTTTCSSVCQNNCKSGCSGCSSTCGGACKNNCTGTCGGSCASGCSGGCHGCSSTCEQKAFFDCGGSV